MPKTILIVDDEKNMLYSLEKLLGGPDCEIITASDGKEAVRKVKKSTPSLVIMDIQMPEMDGMQAFQKIKAEFPKQLVVMMTGSGTTETAIQAMKMGAFDYITKPFEVQEIKQVVEKALLAESLMEETVSLKLPKDAQDLKNRSIIGQSHAMQTIYKAIGQISNSDVSVLILGENGTGKELVARAIYNFSARSSKSFLALNCAAIPENLLESELFGYEKGAFTGADTQRVGKFEQVNGGTLFLDEIGDMPMTTQAKLLRVLQEKQFERVGGQELISVDVRVIAATNRNLLELIQKGRFREDLYYRLNVVTLSLPPLVDRKTDIPALVEYFVARANFEFGKTVSNIPKKALSVLEQYAWPGNVRELENVIKKAVVISRSDTLELDAAFLKADVILGSHSENHLTDVGQFDQYFEETLAKLFSQLTLLPEEHPYRSDLLSKIETILIKKTLEYFKGNQVKTAQLLGITRNTLRSRIEEMA
jgi:nitrogen regulation protein NR(I)